MAALRFQAGIQLSGAGAFRDARRLLDGFPGDDEYELTFEEIETEDEDEEEEAEEDEEDENYNVKVKMNGIRKVNLSETDEDEFNSEEEEDFDLLNNEEDILLERLDPLRVLNKSARAKNTAASTSLNYPLIDPLKLQVIQSAESELTTVHDLFESTSISANQNCHSWNANTWNWCSKTFVTDWKPCGSAITSTRCIWNGRSSNGNWKRR